MEANNQPLVSVPVVTYNSAKYVLETLESIKAQTYQNIELIISDDCSTDNTVELCQKWVEENKKRFIRTQIITVDKNTGVSANLNRAETACQGEWVKGIAGDDLLLPNCVKDCLTYVNVHIDTIYLFGKIKVFGATEEKNAYFENNVFDYSFFDLKIDEQLTWLIFKGNCIPAATCFYNRLKVQEYGIVNDERIPMLEDWPKWINILEKGVKLDFMDKTCVKYRIHENSLSTDVMSIAFYQSNFLFDMYYRYPKWKDRGEEYALKRLIQDHVNYYANLYKEVQCKKKQLKQILHSFAYRIGKMFVRPFSFLRNNIHR